MRKIDHDVAPPSNSYCTDHLEAEARDLAVRAFWIGIQELMDRGLDLNHSRSNALIAINMPEIEAAFATYDVGILVDSQVKQALQSSMAMRFVDVKTVKSRVSGKAKTCWVFDIPRYGPGSIIVIRY